MPWNLTANIKGPPGADGADSTVPGPPGADGADGADGVVQSIVAGANVSVNNADPANPVISASSSGDMAKAVYDPGNVAQNVYDRAFHIGTQLAATISNFSAAADARIAAAVGVTVQAFSAVLQATTASFTTTLKTKLDGIATAATANSPDATLLARANHTGTQLAATISNFAAQVLLVALAGLSVATATAVTAADSILVAIGKLQAQITANLADTVRKTVDSAIIAGITGNHVVDSVVSGTYTPTPVGGNYRAIVAANAFTMNAPAVGGAYTMIIQLWSSAGALCTVGSGWSKVSGVPFDGAAGSGFVCYITVINGWKTMFVEKL